MLKKALLRQQKMRARQIPAGEPHSSSTTAHACHTHAACIRRICFPMEVLMHLSGLQPEAPLP